MFETLPFSVRQTFRVLTPGFFFLLSFSPSSFFRFLILSFFVLFSGIAKQVQDNSRRSNKRSGIRGEKSFSLQTFLPAPYLEGPALKGIVPPDHIASPVRAGLNLSLSDLSSVTTIMTVAYFLFGISVSVYFPAAS